jgi:hypothetical protein
MSRAKSWVAGVMIASLVLPSAAFAESGTSAPASSASASVSIAPPPPKASAEPDVGMTTAPLRKGDKAPFTGVLLSPSAAASIIADIKNHAAAISIEVDKTKKEAEAKCEFDKKNLKADAEADKKIMQAQIDDQKTTITRLDKDLKAAEAAMPSRTVWFGVGFVGGIVLTVITVYGVSNAIGK